ncbi:MAG: helix-turn-helix domain-containing protein [Candidatus Delongbacteria bacterium]|nr:helix-turn-helix domain-containing protein [Candidatus Delongbacteria bacterium]MCG2759955.1 helix-turn-helix domain-containing protein [Candidatus Delongbacteria bacterium]
MEVTYKNITTEEQYNQYLDEFEKLMDIDPDEGTEEGDKFDLLLLLIEEYEARNYKLERPDPIDAIKFRMEQMGLKNKDLEDIIGSKSKVSEVLNKKIKLSLNMIKKLHKYLGIPADVLIQDTYSYNVHTGKLMAVGEKKRPYGKK